MYMTVEDALSIYPLSEGKLIAGKSGLQRIVKSVNVMDAPDIVDWVHEGEVLFTTAYLIKDRPEDGVQLVQKLAGKGTAALGIKLGRFWTTVPESIIEEADRLGFPIIELPFQFTFSDQMNGLFRAEIQKSTHQLQRILEKQQALIRFALMNRSSDFFQGLSAILECPMAVIHARGRLLFNNLPLTEAQLLKGWPWKPNVQWRRSESGKLTLIPLRGNDAQPIGFAVFRSPDGFPSKEEEGLYLQAAEIISFHLEAMSRKQFVSAADNELASILRSYLQQDVSIDAVLECAKKMDVTLCDGPYQCLLTTVSEKSGRSEDNLLNTIRQEFQYHPLLKDLFHLHFFIDGALFSIFPASMPAGERKLSDLLTKLFAKTAAETRGSLRFSLSHQKEKPDQLGDAYRECLNASETAKQLNLSQLVVEYGNVEMAYLFQSVPRDKMKRFCQFALAPILEKSPDSAQEMINTLSLFITHNGQVGEVAKEMFVHRNTVAYRLEKISELLQMDLKNYEHLLKLNLAFLFQSILEQEVELV
ncbi:PucR family transcriptional regulator [Paenibacillus caui]|uniref:PucR family transcriptional regulator n=1 Tax=Paenibacillus caui TaxID=2873927 RepID=UPI001CA8ABAF|nr:PucR family transcriptional regulator [Paenibacillus caui]